MIKTIILYVGFSFLIFTSFVISMGGLSSQSIRLDESQSLWVATKPIISILKSTAQDVHVPLYNLLLHFWVQVFGREIIIARVLSFVFFILTLPVLYILGKEASSKRVAFLTIALFTLSPFVVWFSNEARMYTLFTLVTTTNHMFFLRMVRSGGEKGKLGFFISTVLGFYTHYFFLFLMLTQGLFVVIQQIIKVRSEGRSLLSSFFSSKSIAFVYMGLVLIAFILFLPWIVYVGILGGASNTQPFIPTPSGYNIFQTFVDFLFGFQNQAIQAILISLWPLSVMTLFFIFTQGKRASASAHATEYFVLVTFLPIMLVFAISFIRPIFLSRYLIFVTPTLFFLIAWVLMSYSRKISYILVLLLLMSMFALMIYQNTSQETPVKEDYKGVANYISQEVSSKDIIAVSPPFTIYPMEYSYSGVARIDTIPQWNRYKEGAMPEFSLDTFKKQMEIYRKRYARLFIVLSYDQGYERDIRTHLDNNYHLLKKKEFSEGLEVRVYKLRYDI